MKPPALRVLFLLVFVGALLISALPQAVFILPVLDVIGMDVVTVIVALELRHYLSAVTRFARLTMHPMVWVYRCMWGNVCVRMFRGTTPSSTVERSEYDGPR